VIDANGLALAHVYGQPTAAIALSDQRLTDDEAERIARLIVRRPELVELERDRNRAKSRRKPQPLRSKPVTIGDLARDGKLLEVECSACRPSRHLYVEPLSLGLPKRLPVPEVADHLRLLGLWCPDSELKRPVRPDASEYQGSANIRDGDVHKAGGLSYTAKAAYPCCQLGKRLGAGLCNHHVGASPATAVLRESS
jgi:hypothetical protein